VEPLSLDEAYLDVTEDKLSIGSAITIAEEIRKSIREELQLTASAGISINKFVAKIASEMKKPDGLTFIGPSKIAGFMEELPVEKFFGVGKVTAAKMNALNIFKGADLKNLSEKELTTHFGKTGSFFYQIVRGIDDRAVEPSRETKSVGAEDTFAEDLFEADDLFRQLEKLAAVVAGRLTKHNLMGRTITVKIKYNDFKVITRSKSFTAPQMDRNIIMETAKELLVATLPAPKGIRLLGISLSNFGELIVTLRKENDGPQLRLDF
jgi:DNA polymerase-4